MLDVSLITAGGLELVPGPVDLREVVREVLDRFDLELQQRQSGCAGCAAAGVGDLGCQRASIRS